jgi:hypothetical protein
MARVRAGTSPPQLTHNNALHHSLRQQGSEIFRDLGRVELRAGRSESPESVRTQIVVNPMWRSQRRRSP